MGSFSLVHWLIFGGIAFVVYKAIKGTTRGRGGAITSPGGKICPQCGTRGEPKTITKGSFAIEIILWLCLLIPGLIYSIWRLTTRYEACPSCNQPGMIGINTPMGKALMEKINQQVTA
jgi:hypothetical protein